MFRNVTKAYYHLSYQTLTSCCVITLPNSLSCFLAWIINENFPLTFSEIVMCAHFVDQCFQITLAAINWFTLQCHYCECTATKDTKHPPSIHSDQNIYDGCVCLFISPHVSLFVFCHRDEQAMHPGNWPICFCILACVSFKRKCSVCRQIPANTNYAAFIFYVLYFIFIAHFWKHQGLFWIQL